jgi:WD40 repeat protein
VCPDGTRRATARQYCHLILFDVAVRSHMVVANEQHKSISSPVFSADCSKFAYAIGNRAIRIWEVDTHSLLREFVVDEDISLFALSPDGTRIASLGKKIQIWEVTCRNPIAYCESFI